MATGTITSLGIGSNGILSSDTLDKLRSVDEDAQLTPIDTKLTTNSTKQTDLSTIQTLAKTMKSYVSDLANDTNYVKRTTTVSDDAVSVEASDGTNVQNFNLHVDTLAKQDIYQSTSFASQTSTFTTNTDAIKLNINGKDYSFNVTSTTTLSDLKDMINEKMDGQVTASIINTGGTNPYRLIIKSDNTGADNAITISSGTASTLTSLGLDSSSNHLQTATDASFTYNGVSVTRSSNTIDDLINGVSITLNSVQDSGVTSSVSVAEDWTDLKSTINSFVSAYNELMTNLDAATAYNQTESTKGTFQGVSQIVSFKTQIDKEILKVDTEGRSLVDYGISLNDAGTLEFDESTFNDKIQADSSDVKDFFAGSTTYTPISYTGSAVGSGALNVTYGDLTINDTSIKFTTSSSATAADNVAALQKAINDAGIEGVTASVGQTNNIILTASDGVDLTIKGSSTALTALGLKASTTYAKSTTNEGLFNNFKNLLNEYLADSTGSLSLYSTYLQTEATSLTTQREKLVASLDTKYEALYKKWASYDSIISKLTSSFQSLSYLIDSSNNSSNSSSS